VFYVNEEVGMLDRGDKADPLPLEKGKCLPDDGRIKVLPAGFVNNIGVIKKRAMPEVNEYISICQEIEC
jgi:hypothetical protein